MKIIIIGDGKVGYHLAENLSKENSDVVIIDKNSDALKKASEHLDVMCIKGSGVSTKILLEAGIREADVLIAATSSDEMNMVCCLTAKKMGAKHTIARIRDPEYADELSQLKADLDLDMIINPEQAVALEIARLIKFPPAVNVEIFAKGLVEIVEIKATRDMSIVGMPLRKIPSRISSSILIGAVSRGGEVIIPRGDFTIQADDMLYIVGRPSKVFDFCTHIGIHVQKIRDVLVVGGGRVAYYLTNYLDELRIKVKIIENNEQRCVDLAELLPHALVIHGDGTDGATLLSENLGEMGAFISLTGHDEDNLISALYAKRAGVNKVIAKIGRMNDLNIISDMGIDNFVSPKQITANYILRYVRGLQNALGDPVTTLYRIIDGKAEAMEFVAGKHTHFLNKPLKVLDIAEGVLVAAIVRRNEIIIPHGEDVVREGDSVILITTNKRVLDLNDIVESRGER